MAELKYWLWLTSRRGMTPGKALMLLDHFVTPERVYYADREEYDLLPLNAGQRLGLEDKSLDIPQRILADCDRLGVDIMTFQDAAYPQRLRQLAQPPAVLYWKGKKFRFDEEAAIAVVGAREPSRYGEMAAEKFGLELAKGGALVVSGIARGLDACAIRGALKGGGPVVSLLAGGVDRITPKENRFLAQDVASVGALISEYPPGTEPKGEHYRPRNRILSGLCLGVLAVECLSFGGTMLTVNHALEQDRDIFAVPGAIDAPMSEGTNRLIQQGAKLVTCGRDILEEYWDRFPLKLAAAAPLPPQVAQARLESGREAPAQTQPPRGGEENRPLRAEDAPRTGTDPPEGAEIPLYRRRAADHRGFEGAPPGRRPGGGAHPDLRPLCPLRPHHAPGPGGGGGAARTAVPGPGGAGRIVQKAFFNPVSRRGAFVSLNSGGFQTWQKQQIKPIW